MHRGHGCMFDGSRIHDNLERERHGRGGCRTRGDDAVDGRDTVLVDAVEDHPVDISVRKRREDDPTDAIRQVWGKRFRGAKPGRGVDYQVHLEDVPQGIGGLAGRQEPGLSTESASDKALVLQPHGDVPRHRLVHEMMENLRLADVGRSHHVESVVVQRQPVHLSPHLAEAHQTDSKRIHRLPPAPLRPRRVRTMGQPISTSPPRLSSRGRRAAGCTIRPRGR